MRPRHALVLLTLPVLAAGCFSAPDACRDYVQVLCERQQACSIIGSEFNCAQIAERTDECDRVIGVAPNYDACVAETPDIACSVFFTGGDFPDSCQGAFLAVPAAVAGPARNRITGLGVVIRTSTTS